MSLAEVGLVAGEPAGTPGSTTLPVAVVICAYTVDRWSDIVAGIDSLRRQTLSPAEVVLVVDYNESLADRAVRELCPRLATLQVISNSAQRGLSGARNTGIGATAAPLVAFLDDDACPEPTWLAELVRPFESPLVFVTGGKAVPAWPDKRPRWWPEEFDWVIGCSYKGLPERTADVRNVLGCSMALRREAFVIAGLFTPGIGRIGTKPSGCEETELCIRLRQQRPETRITYTPHALVNHRVSTARTKARYFMARCFAEGISKAQIAQLVGAHEATSSERSYVRSTLPKAFRSGLHDVLWGDWAGLARASAITLGLLVTVSGFSARTIGRT